MTDVERELRELGERTQIELGDTNLLKPATRRRIWARRFALSGVSILSLLALIAGATYAGGAFLGSDKHIGPVHSDGATFGRFFPRFEGGLVTIVELNAAEGTACYDLTSLMDVSSLERIEIIPAGAGDQGDTDPVLALKPNEGHFSPRGGGDCVRDLDKSVLGEVIGDPESYWLLVLPATGLPLTAPLSERVEQDRSKCGPPLDFEPTYVPDGWIKQLQPGSGGGAAWMTVGHYGSEDAAGTTDKARAGFADLIAGESPYPLTGGEEIRVLGEPALLGVIHEGFSVEFRQHGCDYSLIAFGIGRDELRRFAEGLRLTGEFLPAEPAEESFGALWPEDTAQEAEDACADEASPTRTFRHDPVSTALEFGDAVLGWDDAAGIDEQQKSRYGSTIELRRSQSDVGKNADGPAVWVFTAEVVPGCWSVVSVSRPPDNKPTGVGISVRGRDVEVSFDDLGADSIYFEIGHGYYTNSSDPEPPDGRITALLNYPLGETGHFLLLFKDEKGEVFSATGGPLPAGNFAAG